MRKTKRTQEPFSRSTRKEFLKRLAGDVRRMTGIPPGAENPTRDMKVIVGEEAAAAILALTKPPPGARMKVYTHTEHTEGSMPLREALLTMTDERIDAGQYSAQTVLDLRDALRVLLKVEG